MKKILICAIILSALFLQAAAAEFRNYADLDVTLISQNPDPVKPGEYVELRFKIENSGYEKADQVEVELLPEFPFSLEIGEDKDQYFGTVLGRQLDANAYTFDFKVRVDNDAVEGENEIEVRLKSSRSDWIKKEFLVDVQSPASLVSLKEFSSDPLRIKPGELVELNMTMWNGAYSFIRDIKVGLDLIKPIQTATSLSYEELPFSPIGSSEEKIIKKIEGRAEQQVSFKLLASPDAETKVYKVPVSISYYDSNGRSYNQTNIISLIVGDKPDLVVGIQDSEIYKVGQNGKITARFVNKGMSEVKYLYVKMLKSENYKLLSSEDVYVGNIDSDDYETAEFDVILKKCENGYVNIPIEIEYKDANNVEYTRQETLKLKLLSDEEAIQTGLKQESSWLGIAITAGIIIVGFIIYRVYRKRKKKKNHQ